VSRTGLSASIFQIASPWWSLPASPHTLSYWRSRQWETGGSVFACWPPLPGIGANAEIAAQWPQSGATLTARVV